MERNGYRYNSYTIQVYLGKSVRIKGERKLHFMLRKTCFLMIYWFEEDSIKNSSAMDKEGRIRMNIKEL